ncbi:MAG: hypothetical protein KF819_03500 [Labilithrix sp.]|nr:hypothetical protein [Labilithrix sp.]
MLETKMFTLASAMSIMGLVVTATSSGCTGKENEPGAGVAVDGGGPNARSDGGIDNNATCPTTEEIDAKKLPWKPPTIAPGACTDKDLAAFVKFVDSADNNDYKQWKGSVQNTRCRDCIFGKDGQTWSPMVENAQGDLAVLNVGGCVAIATGNEACGKAYQNWVDCRISACSTCPGGEPRAVQSCLSKANDGACKAAFTEVGTVCGEDKVADAEKACKGSKYIFEGPIKAQCIGSGGGEATDAGSNPFPLPNP